MQMIHLPSSICKLGEKSRIFLWTDKENVRRMHRISQDQICCMKHVGGLEIRSSRQVQVALLSKLGKQLLSKPQSLWAKVLTSKYGSGRKEKPIFRHFSGASSLWRRLSKCSNLVNRRIWWDKVPNGVKTRFWLDSWVGHEPLIRQALVPIEEDEMNSPVDDFWEKDSGWMWEKFSNRLPAITLLKIAAITMNHKQDNENDGVTCLRSSSGLFTTTSAYEFILPEEKDVVDRLWNAIWGISCAEKFKTHAWLVVHNRILTNMSRWRKNLTTTPTCEYCWLLGEDTLHALRDCFAASQIWNKFVDPKMRMDFYSWDIRDWVYYNCTSHLGQIKEHDWGRVFLTIMWFLWKWRCYRVLDGYARIPFDQYSYLQRHIELTSKVMNLEDSQDEHEEGKQLVFIRWDPPPSDWYKLNTDGASKGNPGMAAAGGVIRGYMGQWCRGYARNLGICTAIEAELWAVVTGLELAWNEGIRRLIVENDSMLVIKSLHNDLDWSSVNVDLILECKSLLNRQWQVKLQHMYREGNAVADGLANKGLELSLGVHYFDSPPIGVSSLVFQDLSGAIFPRLIYM